MWNPLVMRIQTDSATDGRIVYPLDPGSCDCSIAVQLLRKTDGRWAERGDRLIPAGGVGTVIVDETLSSDVTPRVDAADSSL